MLEGHLQTARDTLQWYYDKANASHEASEALVGFLEGANRAHLAQVDCKETGVSILKQLADEYSMLGVAH